MMDYMKCGICGAIRDRLDIDANNGRCGSSTRSFGCNSETFTEIDIATISLPPALRGLTLETELECDMCGAIHLVNNITTRCLAPRFGNPASQCPSTTVNGGVDMAVAYFHAMRLVASS